MAGGVHGGGAHGGGHAWQGACMAGEGCAWWGGMHGRGGLHGGGHVWRGGACVADTTRYDDTVNEPAVRILLECILVTLLLDTIKEAQKVYI